MTPDRQRPRMLAGLGLPIRAFAQMVRDPEERGPALLVISLLVAGAMSLATVGYGDVVPDTDAGKVFTVVYVLAGIGILVSFFTALTSKTLALQAERRRARGLS